MTAEELEKLRAVGVRHALVRGELRTMSPAGFDHGAVGINLARELSVFVYAGRLGVVVGADTGFVIGRNPDTVRSPDVAFVRQDRVPQPRPVKFWEGAPDLAVEVVSPSDTVFEVDETVQAWLDAGTVEVLIVNPRRHTVKIMRRDFESRALCAGDVLEGLQTLPAFRCPVDAVFA
jgi:Uma2 family endonuclease